MHQCDSKILLRVINISRKGENAGYLLFSHFKQAFSNFELFGKELTSKDKKNTYLNDATMSLNPKY